MQIFSPLVGVSFRGSEARDIVKSLTTDSGHMLSLEAEPDNPYDDHAVKVLYLHTEIDENGDEILVDAGVHIGYLARENNRQVHEALMLGTKFDIEIISFENSIKPILLISVADDEMVPF